MSDTLAAIDLGTNSFHLVVARVTAGDRFEVIEREKEMVRLGSGSGDMKELAPEAIDRGIAALGRFRQVADIHDAKIYAVATSAVREAENAEVFLRRAEVEAGVHVEVVAGVEEARLIYLGALQALPVFDRRVLLLDIGGGSTELLVGERGQILSVTSLKLGAIRLTRRFFRSNRLHPGALDSCRRYVRATLAPTAREVRRHGFELAVGTSGSIGAVLSLVLADREDEPPRALNHVVFTRAEVKAAVRRLVEAETLDERRKLPGLDEKRADIALAGAVILEQVLKEFRIDEMTFSDYALREGVLLDAMQRERGATLHHLHDLRRRSVVHLAELMDEDLEHSTHVAGLALELFDGLRARHELGDDAREVLEAAALLANVGQFVSHSAHHKHSYYVIRNSDHLMGFTDHEIELVALVARYHRKSAPKPSHGEFAALAAVDQRRVRVLAGILRVAIGLDRTHSSLVERVTVEDDEHRVVVDAVPRFDGDIALELFSANERKALLEDVLDCEVVVTAVADSRV